MVRQIAEEQGGHGGHRAAESVGVGHKLGHV